MQEKTIPEVWTVLSLLQWSTNHLQSKNFENARLQVELLLAYALQFNRVQLYTNYDKPLSPNELALFRELLKRKLKNEPLQYILGETEFYGLKFFVDNRVLIPRPETELLVEEILALCKKSSEDVIPSLLDIGTGSGNIPIILAKYLSEATLVSLDCSRDALDVARKNAEYHCVAERINFVHHNIFMPMNAMQSAVHSFDMIVSNPPYIAKDEVATLPPDVRDYEPQLATTDDGDGYKFYYRIAEIGKELLRGEKIVAVEIAFNQSKKVQHIFAEFGYRILAVKKDYSGYERIIIASLN